MADSMDVQRDYAKVQQPLDGFISVIKTNLLGAQQTKEKERIVKRAQTVNYRLKMGVRSKLFNKLKKPLDLHKTRYLLDQTSTSQVQLSCESLSSY